MNMYEILVPTMMLNCNNEIRPVKTRYHKVWDSKVRAISSGLTIFSVAKGQWQSPEGTLFIERMIPVRIVCTEEQINTIADMTAQYYRQEAILFYLISTKAVIKHYEEKNGKVKAKNG